MKSTRIGIRDLKAEDIVVPSQENGLNAEAARQRNDKTAIKLRNSLRTVLSLVGKCVSQGHYNSVVRHSTSLKWIYDMLRSDYDIQQKGIHFFNLLDVKYDQSKMTPVAFYNQYRTIVSNNLAKRGDTLKYKNNEELKAFKQTQFNRQPRKAKVKSAQQSFYCRLCMLAKLPREIYTSHNFGDFKCTQISYQDRQRLKETVKMSNIQSEEFPETDDNELAEMFGYGHIDVAPDHDPDQVMDSHQEIYSNNNLPRNEEANLNFIKPVPSQILTMYLDQRNKFPIHIDLDSGATVNFITESHAKNCGFKILPNGQLSKLGDGVTKLKGIGEINQTFFRNNWQVTFRAIVCKQLTSPVIGGTVFIRDNGVEQDFVKNVIHVHNRRHTVQPTDPVSILPSAPIFSTMSSKVNQNPPSQLLSFNSFKSRVLLPGQDISVPVDKNDGTIVSIEPFVQNVNCEWPESQLQQVVHGKINLRNSTFKPILLGKDVKQFQVRETKEIENPDPTYYKYQPKLSHISSNTNISLIKQEEIKSEKAKELIDRAHEDFQDVFNKDLSQGYNGYYGKHECQLNWATAERPAATKVRVPSYDHDLKGLQQALMDDLTDQGVLLVPQEHRIKVQSVCPSFIQRKQRAKNKPKQQLTKDDVRLLINFGPVNELIKPVPIHVPKTDDVLIMLGRWKFIIIFDLFSGYFQNHMSQDSIPWLGVQTPFGGLRVMARSGQGLMGMAEEFDELLAKVLKPELQDAICCKIVDDVVVGGDTQEEAAANYYRVLSKLHLANIKITPDKTTIFPKSADILGWVWKEGGYLEASEHRKFALTNTKVEDIKKVQDMRSWVGLFKTLHIVTPQIAEILSPFESSTAGKESKEDFVWNYDLEKKFREAKENINKLITLYLPSPQDQLIMETDAAKGGGKNNLPAGIGHILYAIKDDQKLPVRIHSVKLPDKCQKWSPCEIEALSFAAGINKEYDIIRESVHPLIILPDSKPVHEAVKMINQGKFSTSARMSSFLTNVNRTQIISKHVSGKAKLNPISDLQSRNPSDCSSEFCSIHKFIDEAINSVIDEGAKNCKIGVNASSSGYNNRESWKAAQSSNQACIVAKQLLSSGKPPPKAVGKHSGEYWNDIRQYCRDGMITKDGLLVVKAQPDIMSGNIPREKIVIPKPLVPALLYHLHNHNDQHPTKSQQKSIFQRQFYAIGLDKHLELLYSNCYKCSVVKKLPKEIIFNETKTEVEGPQTHFHADIIKRAQQNILTVKDHFSSFQDATIIESEKAIDLKNGLISLTSSMRRPAEVFISVDNSPGFKTLMSNSDEDLKKLNITILKTDEINKNSNAVIDKGCQELEDELKRIEPEGGKIDISILKLAILNLNSKLRRRGNISSYEINAARDQHTGNNLKLDDKELRVEQIQMRNKGQKIGKMKEPIDVGDTVRIANKSDKHKANEMYLVTSKENENIGIQKLLHPLKQTPGKMMSKVYQTNQKHVTVIHKPEFPKHFDVDDYSSNQIQCNRKVSNEWNPISNKFFNDDDDSDEDESINENVYDVDSDSSSHINPSEAELEWDNSPELVQLEENQNPFPEETLEQALQPCQLFQDNDNESSPSGDEVFHNAEFETPPSAPKLQRRNAMRVRQKQGLQPRSEPRVTRTMLSSGNYRQSISNPTSPSAVELGPRVQLFHEALQNVENRTRRSSRIRSNNDKVDYKKLHNYGRKN